MRILVNYLGRYNSGPIFALEMAKGFLECGNDVTVLISDDTSNIQEWNLLSDKMDIHKIHTYSSKGKFLLNTIKFIVSRKRLIKMEFGDKNFDMIVNPMHHLWSTLVCDCFKTRIVTVCHDPNSHDGEARIETYLTQKLMRQSDDIVVLTKAFIPIVQEKYHISKNRIHYMPHGILDIYKKKKAENKLFEYSDKKWHLLFFGRIEEYKGIEVILEAFRIIERERKDIDLIIAGNGNIGRYSHLLKTANISVINDYIPDENVADFFDHENVIVVLPYISASQSGVVAVALDFNNLIVASDVGGLKEQLDDGNVGIFVKPRDSCDLAIKIKDLIDNKQIQIQQKEAIRKLRKKLAWDEIVKNLYKELVDSSNL